MHKYLYAYITEYDTLLNTNDLMLFRVKKSLFVVQNKCNVYAKCRIFKC
jgi:hypothetical protein